MAPIEPSDAQKSPPPKASAAVVEKKAYTAADRLKLLQGAAGIYFFFIMYGRMQERIFKYKSASGKKFTSVWFLQLIDALCNVAVGGLGRQLQGSTAGLPQDILASSGFLQVLSKYCLSASLAAGLSFPVATLAKSAKMVPVMIGSLLIGGQKFGNRQLAQAAAIVGGTSLVTLSEGGGKGGGNSGKGLLLVLGALACDGFVGGQQKRLKSKCKEENKKVRPYDLMFWSNFYMAVGSVVAATAFSEMRPGFKFLRENPELLQQVLKFGVCGAMGQASIFYTIANFDPVVSTAVTTTRKLISVLVSLFEGGGELAPAGWLGLSVAGVGILGEVI
jgi:UDP-galactose transporter B1